MKEIEFKDYETSFSVNGQKYGVVYSFVADTAEVLQVIVEQVWDYDTDLFVPTTNQAKAAANRAAEAVWHNWMHQFT